MQTLNPNRSLTLNYPRGFGKLLPLTFGYIKPQKKPTSVFLRISRNPDRCFLATHATETYPQGPLKRAQSGSQILTEASSYSSSLWRAHRRHERTSSLAVSTTETCPQNPSKRAHFSVAALDGGTPPPNRAHGERPGDGRGIRPWR